MISICATHLNFIIFALIVYIGHFTCIVDSSSSIEAPDGSVCFNGCSGHGVCADYTCTCYHGFHGDDCSVTYLSGDLTNIVPILGAGHFNLTRKNFTQAVIKNKHMLVGFSSYNCHKCIVVEKEYEKTAQELLKLKIPFGRVDVDKLKSISSEHGAVELPALVWFNKQKHVMFRGVHQTSSIMAYIQKQLAPPIKMLKVRLWLFFALFFLYMFNLIYITSKWIFIYYFNRLRLMRLLFLTEGKMSPYRYLQSWF